MRKVRLAKCKKQVNAFRAPIPRTHFSHRSLLTPYRDSLLHGFTFHTSAVGRSRQSINTRRTVNPMRLTDATRLVNRGRYRLSGRPIYCGRLIALLGWGAIRGSLLPLVTIVLLQRTLVVVHSLIFRGHCRRLVVNALRKSACAAAMPPSGRSIESAVLPCLSTAR